MGQVDSHVLRSADCNVRHVRVHEEGACVRDSGRGSSHRGVRAAEERRDERPHAPVLVVVLLADRVELRPSRARVGDAPERTFRRGRGVFRAARRLVLRVHAHRKRSPQPADELGLPAHVGGLQACDPARPVRGNRLPDPEVRGDPQLLRGEGKPQGVLAVDDPGARVLPSHELPPDRPCEREGRPAGRLHPEGEVHFLPRDARALDRLRARLCGGVRAFARDEEGRAARGARKDDCLCRGCTDDCRLVRVSADRQLLRQLPSWSERDRVQARRQRAERPHLRLAVRRVPARRREGGEGADCRRRGAASRPRLAAGDGSVLDLLRRDRPGAFCPDVHDLFGGLPSRRLPYHAERPCGRHLHVGRT